MRKHTTHGLLAARAALLLHRIVWDQSLTVFNFVLVDRVQG